MTVYEALGGVGDVSLTLNKELHSLFKILLRIVRNMKEGKLDGKAVKADY